MLAQLLAIPALGDESGELSSKPSIGELTARLETGQAIVSFRVVNGLSDEAMERIDSGIRVELRHRLEIVTKRAIPLMPSKVLARTVIRTRAEYDALTRRYVLARAVESRGPHKKQAPPPSEEQRFTTSAVEMRAWMTQIDEIPVYDPVEPFPEDEQLKVRVESSLGRRYVLLIFPSTVTATAELQLSR
jgi:hypothetical protein